MDGFNNEEDERPQRNKGISKWFAGLFIRLMSYCASWTLSNSIFQCLVNSKRSARGKLRPVSIGPGSNVCASNDFGPNISIWYKPEKPTRARPVANEAVYDKFPREALLLFSDLYRGKIINGDKAVYLPDGCNIKIYKEIFEWIKECIATGDLVDFPTVSRGE